MKLTFDEWWEMPQPMSQIVAIRNIHLGKGKIVKKGETVLCLGEISNMRCHIAFVRYQDDLVYWGYHPDNFRRMTEDD